MIFITPNLDAGNPEQYFSDEGESFYNPFITAMGIWMNIFSIYLMVKWTKAWNKQFPGNESEKNII